MEKTNDKATARPLTLGQPFIDALVFQAKTTHAKDSRHDADYEGIRDMATELVKRYNEHAALVAVAEAAAITLHNLENTTGWNMPFKSTTADGGKCSNGGTWVKNQGGDTLHSALANLAAVRGE